MHNQLSLEQVKLKFPIIEEGIIGLVIAILRIIVEYLMQGTEGVQKFSITIY